MKSVDSMSPKIQMFFGSGASQGPTIKPETSNIDVSENHGNSDGMRNIYALESLKHSNVPIQNQISPYLQIDPSIFKNSQPQYIMPEDNGRVFGLTLSHVGLAVGTGFGVGCARGFIGELLNPDTRKLAMKPWFTRILNATTKHGSGYAQPAGTVVFLYYAVESMLKLARADDPLNSFVAGAIAGGIYRSPHGARALAIGSAAGLALATLWNVGNADNRHQLREMMSHMK